MNKVFLVGNLGRDPELVGVGNIAVCKLSLATQEKTKVNGEWQDKTEWHRVTCFGKLAETCMQHTHKGSQILVEGRIQTSSYMKDDEKRYSTEVVAQSVKFLGAKEPRKEAFNGDSPQITVPTGATTQPIPFADDDIPF